MTPLFYLNTSIYNITSPPVPLERPFPIPVPEEMNNASFESFKMAGFF
jgi:hypothetical protein